MANFIPPSNGAGLGSYFCVKNLSSAIKHSLNVTIQLHFEAQSKYKLGHHTQLNMLNYFSKFYSLKLLPIYF